MQRHLLLALAALGAASTLTLAAPSFLPPASEEFEDLELTLQLNGPEEELALILAMEVAEEFTGVDMMDPAGNAVVGAHTTYPQGLGLHECVFETKADPAAGLAAYPEGPYRVIATAADGTLYAGVVVLSHDLPLRPRILSPHTAVVPLGQDVLFTWLAPDATEVRLEVETEDRSLDVNLPATETSFRMPASMLVPGAEYKVTVTAVAENGNEVEDELFFWADR